MAGPPLPRLDAATLRAIPTGVWALGLVSLLMDVSSEMIHALLPVYLVGTLGASTAVLGLIEGVAEATAAIVKVFSGAVSDWLGRRKLLALAGYGLAALTKPVFPLAGEVGWVAAARFVDRIGKGIRGAPRDALVADLAPPALRGAAFGLRQSLDTVGAFAGPLAAIALMAISGDDITLVFWVAVLPAFLCVAVLLAAVPETRHGDGNGARRFPLGRHELARLGTACWLVVGLAAVFGLARFSEAFLILRAQGAGLSLGMLPVVLVLMNATYMVAAYPAGVLSDRLGRTGVLAAGMALLVVADGVLAASSGMAAVIAGVAIWGLHMGLTQGLLAAMVADAAPADLRGTAFGIFNLVTGVALLAASLIAGVLWDTVGPAATFLAGGAMALAALLALLGLARRT